MGNDEGNRTWRMEYWRGLSACRRASVCSSIPRDKQSSQLIMRLVIYLRAGLGISTSHHRRRCLPAVDTNALSKTIYPAQAVRALFRRKIIRNHFDFSIRVRSKVNSPQIVFFFWGD